MDKNTTRYHILKAANQIVKRDGVAHLTIEAVAREAGLSKGGVLYHFPSKDLLIEGMITSLLEGFEGDLTQAFAQEDESPGRWLRAYIRASSEPAPVETDAATALIAAISTNPRLLDPVRQRYDLWQELTERDGLAPAFATILRLATDGLWFADLLELAAPSGQLRAEVVQTLLDMAHAAPPAEGDLS